jgi:hypothetical protein
VTWGNTLQPCVHIVAKATRVSFTIKRTIANLTLETGQLLSKVMVRPILEYAAVSWSPTYNERLRSLNLFSLRHRRRRGDLIELFKLSKNNGSLLDPYRGLVVVGVLWVALEVTI